MTEKTKSMSAKKCGEYQYGNISQTRIDVIIDALKKSGATVNGNNPWDIDMQNNGIKLKGAWNSANLTLSIVVTEQN